MSQYFFQLKSYILKKFKAFIKKPLLLEIITGTFFSVLIIAISVSGQEKETLRTDFEASDDYIVLEESVANDVDIESENQAGWPEYERGDALSEIQESITASSAISTPRTNKKTYTPAPTAIQVTATPVATEIPVTPTPQPEEEIVEVPEVTIVPDATPEPTPEVILDPNGPVIVTDMEQVHQTTLYTESITVTGYNSQGDKLPKENFEVKLNDITVYPELVYNNSISYRLNYLEGTNNLKVIVKDENLVEKAYDFVIAHNKPTEPTAIISVDADSIGMGYMIPPTAVTLQEGKTVGYYVKELLKANGFSTYSSGSQNNNYRFKGLYRSDLFQKCSPVINEDLFTLLQTNNPELGLTMDKYYNNFIKNGYYTDFSQWVFEINGIRYFDYMSNYTLNDGDILRVRFSLAAGIDLDWLNTYYLTETTVENTPTPSESIIE